jgi:hypothetical protein
MLPKTACAAACGVNNAQLNANNANAQRTIENFFIAASPPSLLFFANGIAQEKRARAPENRADDRTCLEDPICRFCPCSDLCCPVSTKALVAGDASSSASQRRRAVDC